MMRLSLIMKQILEHLFSISDFGKFQTSVTSV